VRHRLTPTAAVAAVHPDVLDLASGVESAPGLKDLAKVERAFRSMKTIDL